ncbi:MAG TPA: GxxExxY protein [Sphingobacteriaceae bacterium]|nr:GxxExxY protein [Sphingobacteriaceae bacterium]
MESSFENDPLTAKIIGCCFAVHRELGPGFNEKIYSNALQIVLVKERLNFIAEKEFVVYFEGKQVGKFRCDLLVENSIIVELKSVAGYSPKLFQNQVISYLKASNMKTGLLINFGNSSCEIKRLSV